jgi:AraC family transcriptional regulator
MSGGSKETTLRFYKERLLRVLLHIQQHLNEPLPLEELAALACLSPYHFHHVFTGMLHESLGSHIRRLRLERAASRLKLTRMPIVEVAFEAGYATHEAFTRAFHKAFGVSPIRFRQRAGVTTRLEVPSGVHYQKALRQFRCAPMRDKSMNVVIKEFKPMRVAFVRHVGPYDEVGKTWEQFVMFLGKEGLLGGCPQFIGISYDDPAVTPAERVRYDACVTADKNFQANGEFGVQIIPGGVYAVLTHFGAYHHLGDSYEKLLGEWLPRSKRMLRDTPCFEIYFNSPENTEPGDLVTDICAPLETD